MKMILCWKYCLMIVSIILFVTLSCIAQTIIPAGNVSGTWTSANSPYHISGEITIPSDSTLTIEPGVEVIFQGHYKFNVQGRLLAVGNLQDSIHFTAEDKQNGWHGIRFNITPVTNDTSKFRYCSFTYGKANTGAYNGPDRSGGAIFIKGFGKVLITNSLFESNMNNGDIVAATGGAAIYADHAYTILITDNTFVNNTGTTDCSILAWYTRAIIKNNIFSENSGPHGPVFCAYESSTISDNVISDNITTRAGGGIFNMTSNDTITNNIIVNNSCFGGEGEGGGIKCWINDKSVIINNTIAYNSGAHGGGLCCNSNSDPILINNIFWGNSSPDGNQVNLIDTQSDPDFVHSDIQGGKEGFGGSGAGVNYTGIYESNIELNPLFNDTVQANYSLSNFSHCIGAGCDSLEVHGKWYYAPEFCIMGNPRPSPAGTYPDIGACESLLGMPLVGVEQELFTNPNEFVLYQNYPNPFNPSTKIKYTVPIYSQVVLKVFDVLGNQIATLVNEEKPSGTYELNLNSANLTDGKADLSSGVYFYQIKATPNGGQAGAFMSTKKMILLR